MTNFIILSMIMVLYFFIAEKRKFPNYFNIIGIIVVISLYSLAITIFNDNLYLGEISKVDQSPLREILLFIIMFSGMIASVLNKAIEKRQKKIELLELNTKNEKHPKISIDHWEVVRPLIFSVFTFSILMTQIGEEHINWSSGTIAFQTGFFWDAILKTKYSMK